ncbi:uncharacterized protein LOC131890298 isoform X2 [Tigriopus californicus]|nr:uncharacterized protein LOC131890298 isoform X2 [Tigriopus californicus]
MSITEVQGFAQALNAHGLKRIIWMCLGFLGVTLTIYHSYSITHSYLRNPFVTKFSRVTQNGLIFPFVALSTTRIVNCDMLEKQLDTGFRLLSTDFNEHRCWLLFYSACKRNRIDLIQRCNETVGQGGQIMDLKVMSESSYANAALNVMNRSVKESILTHPIDYVVESKWEGTVMPLTEDLCATNFSFCALLYHGSLQYFVNYDEMLKSVKMGKGSGLEMILRVPQKNPVSFGIRNDMEGFVLDFVPPRYISGAKRIFIKPGTSVSIGLNQVQHKKLPSPFESSCIHYWNETNFGNMTQISMDKIKQRAIRYHPESCRALCRMKAVVDKCGCVWNSIDPAHFSDLFKEPKCMEYLPSELDCMNNNDLTIHESKDFCNCHDACELVSYDVTLSSSDWHYMERWENVAEEFGILSKNDTTPTNKMDQLMMEKNTLEQFAKVSIFFVSNQRTVIEQSAKFESFWAFFITCGGAMSIYLGISILTLISRILSLCEKIIRIN